MDDTPEQKEGNLRLRFQQFFDDRYVLFSRYSLIEKMIFGLTGVILFGVISAALAFLIKQI